MRWLDRLKSDISIHGTKKVVFIQHSIQSVGPLKALYTFCLPWQYCSFRHQLGFSGKHSSHAAIRAKTVYSHFHHCL